MKPKLKLFFTDFWNTFNIKDNFFYNFIKQYYDVEISEENPDFLFYSVFGSKFHRYNCKRVFFTGENVQPNFRHCDFSLSFEYDDFGGRNFRLPHYVQFGDPQILTEKHDADELFKEKTGFCNFVFSNPKCKKRIDFFRKLSKYKKVDSGGRVLNNIGGPVANKLEFIRKYKFSIAFENESHPGYTTEKIYEPMLVNSIPVYWGNPRVAEEFNSKSFLNLHEFPSEDALIEKIIELDNDDDKYKEMLAQPFFHDNKINKYVDYDNVKNIFRTIFEADIKPVARKSRVFSGSPLMGKIALKNYDASFKARKIIEKIKSFRFYKLFIKLDKMKRKIEIQSDFVEK